MKKPHLLILCSFFLISCSPMNQRVFQSGSIDICSHPDNSLEKKISVIKVSKYNYEPSIQQMEESNSTTGILKDNMFIDTYTTNDKVNAKILDKNGSEKVSIFEIVSSNKLSYFKIITDKKLDHFFVLYQVKDIGKSGDNGIYLKKFDLKGNHLNLVKLDNNESISDINDISFSFDENGKNLILSMVNLKFSHRDEESVCFPFFSCHKTMMVPAEYYNPVVNTFKFDEKLNYCHTRIIFDELFRDYETPALSYISQKRDRVIVPLSYEKVSQINVKENTLKNAYLGLNNTSIKLSSSGTIKTHDLYFASDFVV